MNSLRIRIVFIGFAIAQIHASALAVNIPVVDSSDIQSTSLGTLIFGKDGGAIWMDGATPRDLFVAQDGTIFYQRSPNIYEEPPIDVIKKLYVHRKIDLDAGLQATKEAWQGARIAFLANPRYKRWMDGSARLDSLTFEGGASLQVRGNSKSKIISDEEGGLFVRDSKVLKRGIVSVKLNPEPEVTCEFLQKWSKNSDRIRRIFDNRRNQSSCEHKSKLPPESDPIAPVVSQPIVSVNSKPNVAPNQTHQKPQVETGGGRRRYQTSRRVLPYPAPQFKTYSGMSQDYNQARFDADKLNDQAVSLAAVGPQGNEDWFKDHDKATEALRRELDYWKTSPPKSKLSLEWIQFMSDMNRLLKAEVSNRVGIMMRQNGYRMDAGVSIHRALNDSEVLAVASQIGGQTVAETLGGLAKNELKAYLEKSKISVN